MSFGKRAPVFLSGLVGMMVCAGAQAQDVTPPTVTSTVPGDGSTVLTELGTITVSFNEPMDPATVSESTIRLVRSGGDGTFVDGNEVEIMPDSVTLDGTGLIATVDLAGAKLPNDVYEIRVGQDMSLVGYWALDEGSGSDAFDSSGNGHHGTLVNMEVATDWIAGQSGTSLDFEDYECVDVPSAPGLIPSSAITIAVWARADSWASGNRRIVGIGDSGIWGQAFDNPQGLRFLVGGVLGADLMTSLPSTGAWHHIAGTYDGSTACLYVDGSLAVQAPASGPFSNPYGVCIGSKLPSSPARDFFNGAIDEVFLYGRALTDTEVVELMNSSTPLAAADVAGNDLDGDGDTFAGGDYAATFTLDAPLPEVNTVDPGPGSTVLLPLTDVTVTFTKEMDPGTINENTIRLVRSGGDGTFGDGNEVVIVPDSVTLDVAGTTATVDISGAILSDDGYQVVVGQGLVSVAGLVGHWAFEDGVGSQTAVDSSVSKNDATLGSMPGPDSSDPTWVPGKVGTDALSFDGADDYLALGLPGVPQMGAPKTIAFWCRVDAVPADAQCIFTALAPLQSIQIGFLDSELAVWGYGGRKLVSAAVLATQWCHVAYAYDGTTNSLYVDGALIDQSGELSDTGSLATLEFGRTIGWGEQYEGALDDVRIYDRSLDGAEIGTLAGNDPAVTDLAGNVLDGDGDTVAGGDFVSTFTVEMAAPTVVSTVPVDGMTEVDVGTDIAVTFGELMNEGVTEGAFSVSGGVTGAFAWAGNVMTFTPDSPLDPDTEYTATILGAPSASAAEDLAGGKPLAADYVFVFETPDTIPPQVADVRADAALLTDGATILASPATIEIDFDEEIDPATVRMDTVRLIASGGDGTFGDGNEVEIAADDVSLTVPDVAAFDLTTTLADDVYQVVVDAAVHPETGLVAHWPLDDGSGQTAIDVSGGGNDGTLGGSTDVQSTDPTWDPTGGKTGGALHFDGSDDCLLAGLALSQSDDFTLAAWVYWDGGGGSGQMVVYNGNTATSGYGIVARSQPGGRRIDVLCGGKGYATSDFFIDPMQWYHVATVRRAGAWEIYVDGNPTTVTGIPIPNSPAGATGIGRSPNDASHFQGLIDEVRAYDRPLLAAEVAALAEVGVTDLAGNGLDGDGDGSEGPDYTLTFVVETTAPTVASTSPADGAREADVGTDIVVTFSELMNEAVTEGAFSVAPPVAGTSVWVGNVMTFTPDSPLASDTQYTVTILGDPSPLAAEDFAGGKQLAADYVFTFETPDTTPPQVTEVRADLAVLLDGATIFTSPAVVEIDFDEEIEPATVTTDTVRLVASGSDGSFIEGNEIVIVPDSVTLDGTGTLLTIDVTGTELLDETYRILVCGRAPYPNGSLLVHWTFDEESGTTAPDSSGNGNDGALPAGGVWQPAGGKLAGALFLDGADDFVTRDLVTTQQDNVTLAAWVKWDGPNANSDMVIYNGNTASSGYGLIVSDPAQGNRVMALCGGLGVARADVTPAVGEWHHVAAVRRTGTWELYLDGAQLSVSGNPVPNLPAGKTTSGASNAGTGNFDGSIDDVRFYARALAPAEVALLAAEPAVTDLVGNALDGDGDGTSGPDFTLTFTLDKPPVVESIVLVDTSPTNATSVDFTVTFDQDVTGVATGNFTLYAPDTATGNIASFSGSGSVYTVTVDTITGDGTLRLDLTNVGAIIDGTGNPLAGSFTLGDAYTIDNTAPFVQSIALADTDPTNAETVSFTVTFSEDVTGFGGGDISLVKTGTMGDLFSITPSGANVYAISVINVSGDGTLGLNIIDYNSIVDGAGNMLGGPVAGDGDFTGAFFTVDTVPPDAPDVTGTSSPTNIDTPTWDWVQGASAGNGTFRYQLDAEDEGGWTETTLIEYTPGTALADGAHTLHVQERDAIGNWSDSGSHAVTIDTTPPVVTVTPLVTNDTTPPLSGTVDDAAATISVTVDGSAYAAVNNTDGTWTLADDTVTPALGEGTYDVAVTATDALSNAAGDSSTNELVIDLTAPAVTVDALLTNDDTPELTGTVDDPAATVVVTVASQTFTAVNNGDGTWTLADDTLVAIGPGPFDVQAEATDAVGNTASDATLDELDVDLTPPQVTGVVPAPAALLNAAPTDITITFDEEIDPATVDASSIQLVASGGDGTFGDGNEVVISPAPVTLDVAGTTATVDLSGVTLADDAYRAAVSGGSGPLDSLAGHWKFDDGVGAVAADSSTVPHDASLVGGSWTGGILQGALNFDGIDDSASIPDASATQARRPMSVATWVKRDSVSEQDYILGKKGDSGRGWWFTIEATNKLNLTFGAVLDVQSTGTIADTDWHHVAATVDSSGVVIFYIDGASAGTATIGSPLTTSLPLRLGVSVGPDGSVTSYDDFAIDQLVIYGRALSPSELAALASPVTDLPGNALDGDGDGASGPDYTCTFTLDTVAPTVTTDMLLTNDATPALSGMIDDPTASVSVTVGGNTYPATNNGDGTWSLADDTVTPALADGTYDAQATAADPASNFGTEVVINDLVVDATPPTVTVDALTTTDKTPPLSGTVNDPGATIQVTVDGNSYAATNNGATWTVADNVIAPDLAVGTYDVQVASTDAAGNAGNDATINELVIAAPADPVKPFGGGCAGGAGGGRFALLLPLALALVALKRRRPWTWDSTRRGVQGRLASGSFGRPTTRAEKCG